MRTRISQVRRFFYCLVLISFVGLASVYAEPEPMARPTRPKVITSPEELKRYLDLVKDYYNLNGRARYGKRGGSDVAPMTDMYATWEALKTILDAQRQTQQRSRQEAKLRQSRLLYRDFHSSDNVDKHASRFPTRPGYLLDAVGRYYDDVQ